MATTRVSTLNFRIPDGIVGNMGESLEHGFSSEEDSIGQSINHEDRGVDPEEAEVEMARLSLDTLAMADTIILDVEVAQ